jgi:hypothetical protein
MKILKVVLILLYILLFQKSFAQKFKISGGIDTYYAINPMDLTQKTAPIYVSSNQLNSPSINLALIEFKYQPTEKIRFQLSPAFGTYMNTNYSGEKKHLRWIYESYLGISFGKNKKQWLDIGVYSSPYTFETPKSWDQLMYTRSLAPEFVPYYITGLRYQNEISKKLKLSLFLLNGWQKIGFQNKIPSLGTQLEYKVDKHSISWTTYSGNEKTATQPDFGFRFFTEFSWAFEKNKWKTQTCFYSGWQKIINGKYKNWFQINGLAAYQLTKKSSLTFRQEYFHDPSKIQISTNSTFSGFSGSVSSFGISFKPKEFLLFRVEGKSLYSSKNTGLFILKNQETNWLPLLFVNLSIFL